MVAATLKPLKDGDCSSTATGVVQLSPARPMAQVETAFRAVQAGIWTVRERRRSTNKLVTLLYGAGRRRRTKNY